MKRLMRIGCGGLVAGGMFLVTSPAQAHGFARYVSTPITPPIELRWVFPLSVGILVLVNIVAFREFWRWGWWKSILGAVGVFAVFSGVFFMYGRINSRMSTAPPPGLDFPHPAFWGWGWEKAGDLFVGWNLWGLVILIACLWLARRILKGKSLLWVTTVNIVAYAICLLPYPITGVSPRVGRRVCEAGLRRADEMVVPGN